MNFSSSIGERGLNLPFSVLRYYTATSSESPNERRIFRVRVEPPYTEHAPQCLTCPTFPKLRNGTESDKVSKREMKGRVIVSKDNVILRSNNSCSFVTSVNFSPTKNYFVMECGGPEIPYVALYSTPPTPGEPSPNIPRVIKVSNGFNLIII